ncbi:MAG: hypothetical protein QOD05_224 [Microbacteriaceae bacterium]|jgi:hypothetical protein|nr:hypothetical protein [Leifsonia sp.]MDQ1577291.1 hypothetical protein [Microbacteriaceae bacterium]MDQ1579449.1 hypothetical protein [Microbacteriaceae bacterium]MDQ1589096.1 hypothetical protein [Microbacteriaceae bacterium]MDQ1607492.1 hypothetical protein [Microbacteriaceae bacterium]
MERGESFIVRHSGRDFITTEEMARIFLNQAERALASGEPTLVVLRHSKGVELLLVSDEGCFSVRDRISSSMAS